MRDFSLRQRPIVRNSPEGLAGVTPSDYTKWAEPYDPRRFGAVGNGTADDSTALANAFLVGGDIYIPKGYTFYVPNLAQQTISSRIRLFGGGTLKGTSSLYLLQPAGGDIIAEDITFDTWNGIVESDVADSGTTDLMRFMGCRFLNMSGLTIDHERPINNAIIFGCLFNTVTGESVRIGKNDNSIQDTWKRILISGNRWDGVSSSGSASACGAIVYGKEVVIHGNIVNDVDSSAGSGEAWGFYTKARKATISNNVIIDIVGAGGVATQVGINVKGSQRGDTSNPQGFNVIVSGNYVENAGGYGIRSQADECVVTGNIIEEPGDTAISVDGTGDNIVVTNNKGYVATEGSKVGIRFAQNGTRHVVANNVMEGFAECIRASAAAGETCAHLLITSNVLAPGSTGEAIDLNLNATGTSTNCVIRGNKVSSGARGFQMPTTGTCTGLVIEDNDLRGATTKINGTIPSGSRVQLNQGWVTEAYGVTGGIATGSTVTHGLNGTPTVVHITALETGPTDIYVDTIGATTFKINYGGGGTKSFAWTARLATTYA